MIKILLALYKVSELKVARGKKNVYLGSDITLNLMLATTIKNNLHHAKTQCTKSMCPVASEAD